VSQSHLLPVQSVVHAAVSMQHSGIRAYGALDRGDDTGTSPRDHGGRSPVQGPPPQVCVARVPRLLRYAVIDWLVIGSTWVILWQSAAWIYPIALLILVGRFHALGVVLHDACHMGKRTNVRWTWLLQLLAGYPIGTTLRAMRYHHLRHHRHSGSAQDPYLRIGISNSLRRRNLRRLAGLLLVPLWIARSFFGTVALVLPSLRCTYGLVFLQDRSRSDLAQSREIRSCLRAEPAQAGFFVLVGVVAWSYPAPVLILYFLPLVLAGAVNVNRVIVEHIHVLCADRRPETVAATTVTHSAGLLARMLLFPRNIGYHVVHHLYPQAALETLPELHAWYLRQGREN
jgi:fatty acid desaturase